MNMEQYRNLSGKSSIQGYEIRPTFIIVRFKKTSREYVYSYKSAGKENVENMKELAKQGLGLNSYIMRHVRNRYE